MKNAPLFRRLAALVYESLLIGAVSLIALLPAAILQTVLPSAPATLLAGVSLLAAWWQYFKLNWLREGQTLPMRVWKIGLSAADGSHPPLRQLRLRFVWACVLLIFVPVCAYQGFRFGGVPPRLAFFTALLWWLLPWGFALFNRRRRFLYDYLADTDLTDLRPPQS